MKTRRQDAAEDALTISHSTRPPSTVENSETIPNDLIIEILLRLPARSIARCRCVSKIWASILGRSDFTEMFMTSSWARPQILFSCRKDSELFPFEYSSEIIGPVHGLVCLTHLRKNKKTSPVICNPSTGQSFHLPNVRTKSVNVNSLLGFDPIDQQFKLLSMTSTDYEDCEEHQVLTLGTRKLSWRMIECCISHLYLGNARICINGVLYYVALLDGPSGVSGIICFDVKSEKFISINRAENMALWSGSTLVNYNGKLGALLSEGSFAEVTGETTCFELWVVVDPEKHEWSKHISVSPPTLWKNLVAKTELYFVGVTGAYEIILSQHYLSDPFYVYYYDLKSNTTRRVEIQGMNAFKNFRVHTSLNHIEDVKLM